MNAKQAYSYISKTPGGFYAVVLEPKSCVGHGLGEYHETKKEAIEQVKEIFPDVVITSRKTVRLEASERSMLFITKYGYRPIRTEDTLLLD